MGETSNVAHWENFYMGGMPMASHSPSPHMKIKKENSHVKWKI